MKTPYYLQIGDCVALVATARKYSLDELQPALKLLQQWGLKVVIGNSIGIENNQLAGPDYERAADFQIQLDNPDIKAIWCVRGGYGTVRMIDLLDFTQFQRNPKWIVGFSDVTVLHSHCNTLGVKSLHALMPVSIEKATVSAIQSLHKALFGKTLLYQIPAHEMNHYGKAKGELVGGNLSILYSLLGSPSAINCKDKILFIEDLDEYLYHIDRMMLNLKRNGCLQDLRGIIIGGMTDMNDNPIPWGKTAVEIIVEHTQAYNYPIAFGLPAGHLDDNHTLIMGNPITIDVNELGTTISFE